MSDKKAVVLVSGGLDSTTALAMAQAAGFACYTLSFDYGQRHKVELEFAERVSRLMRAAEHKVVKLDLRSIGGSALTDDDIPVPEAETTGIPTTYVPARNTVFLSIALGWAEVLGAEAIFIGVNAVDYSGYPDCRPDYIEAFQTMANLATRAGVEGRTLKLHTPLIQLSKAEIIQRGLSLGVNYAESVSCYQADAHGRACGLCDSCRLRRKGFEEAGVPDPTIYRLQA